MSDLLLHVKHIDYRFKLGPKDYIEAVSDISFHMKEREIFGIVGESGSGKSTLAKCLMGIYTPAVGEIFYRGIKINDKRSFNENKRILQTERQLIFQDSSSSLNRRMKIWDIITEPMRIHKIKPEKRGSYRDEAAFQLKYVDMDESFLDKTPYELSGGERQRVAIARAMTMEPKLLIADEPVASLDVVTQAQILRLLLHLRKEHNLAILFISHDLLLVRSLCDRVGVMFRGKLVETGTSKEVFANPIHPYTRSLISAVPQPDPKLERNKQRVIFDRESFSNDKKMVRVDGMHHVIK